MLKWEQLKPRYGETRWRLKPHKREIPPCPIPFRRRAFPSHFPIPPSQFWVSFAVEWVVERQDYLRMSGFIHQRRIPRTRKIEPQTTKRVLSFLSAHSQMETRFAPRKQPICLSLFSWRGSCIKLARGYCWNHETVGRQMDESQKKNLERTLKNGVKWRQS